MADLEVGNKVTVIKEPESNPFMISVIGKIGTVTNRVSGGWIISVGIGLGQSFEFIVGSIDWHESVKLLVEEKISGSALPKALEKWYRDTKPYIGRG